MALTPNNRWPSTARQPTRPSGTQQQYRWRSQTRIFIMGGPLANSMTSGPRVAARLREGAQDAAVLHWCQRALVRLMSMR